MKNTVLFYSCLIAVVICQLIFQSCDDSVRQPASTNVFSYKIPRTSSTMRMVVNDSGQLTSIEDGDVKITYKYGRSDQYKGYDGAIYKEGDSPSDFVLFYNLNDKGFISDAILTGRYPRNYTFAYDKSGYLISMTITDLGDVSSATKIDFEYKDGDPVCVKDGLVNSPCPLKYYVTYVNDDVTEPIANRGNIEFPWFRIKSVGSLVYAYYGGLLGISTKNLPLKFEMDCSDGSQSPFEYCFYDISWSINADGLPSVMKLHHKFDWPSGSVGGESILKDGTTTYTYYW